LEHRGRTHGDICLLRGIGIVCAFDPPIETGGTDHRILDCDQPQGLCHAGPITDAGPEGAARGGRHGAVLGVGAALRFLVIAWVPAALKITSNKVPGFLTAMVAVGIVLGAALAARFVRLPTYQRALPAGVLIGIGVCLLPFAKSVSAAVALMIFVGTCSGFFIVPLDALLQRQGEDGVGVGSAIAIQNLYENFSMLALVAGYTAATYTSVPVNDIAVGLGLFIALSMGALTLMRR